MVINEHFSCVSIRISHPHKEYSLVDILGRSQQIIGTKNRLHHNAKCVALICSHSFVFCLFFFSSFYLSSTERLPQQPVAAGGGGPDRRQPALEYVQVPCENVYHRTDVVSGTGRPNSAVPVQAPLATECAVRTFLTSDSSEKTNIEYKTVVFISCCICLK